VQHGAAPEKSWDGQNFKENAPAGACVVWLEFVFDWQIIAQLNKFKAI
jgi:hypothetical protein